MWYAQSAHRLPCKLFAATVSEELNSLKYTYMQHGKRALKSTRHTRTHTPAIHAGDRI